MRNVATASRTMRGTTIVHLRRGEVKPFLKTYLQRVHRSGRPRDLHLLGALLPRSPHKTHEEAWFLMQTRWMLWLEDGATLRLLPGIPRAWLEDGKRIALHRVATYFGPLDLEVTSHIEAGVIEAEIVCRGNRRPAAVVLRLPHPDGLKAIGVKGGRLRPGNRDRAASSRSKARLR